MKERKVSVTVCLSKDVLKVLRKAKKGKQIVSISAEIRDLVEKKYRIALIPENQKKITEYNGK